MSDACGSKISLMRHMCEREDRVLNVAAAMPLLSVEAARAQAAAAAAEAGRSVEAARSQAATAAADAERSVEAARMEAAPVWWEGTEKKK